MWILLRLLPALAIPDQPESTAGLSTDRRLRQPSCLDVVVCCRSVLYPQFNEDYMLKMTRPPWSYKSPVDACFAYRTLSIEFVVTIDISFKCCDLVPRVGSLDLIPPPKYRPVKGYDNILTLEGQEQCSTEYHLVCPPHWRLHTWVDLANVPSSNNRCRKARCAHPRPNLGSRDRRALRVRAQMSDVYI